MGRRRRKPTPWKPPQEITCDCGLTYMHGYYDVHRQEKFHKIRIDRLEREAEGMQLADHTHLRPDVSVFREAGLEVREALAERDNSPRGVWIPERYAIALHCLKFHQQQEIEAFEARTEQKYHDLSVLILLGLDDLKDLSPELEDIWKSMKAEFMEHLIKRGDTRDFT